MYNNPRYRAKLVYINTDYNGIAIFDYEENEEFSKIRDFVSNWFEWGGNSHAVSNYEQFKNSADFERWMEL